MFLLPQVLKSLVNDRNKFLRARTNQFLLSFSFWPTVSAREGGNIYEIRSYFLKVSKVATSSIRAQIHKSYDVSGFSLNNHGCDGVEIISIIQ